MVTDPFNQAFAAAVRERRACLRLSRAEAGKLAGVLAQRIADIENGATGTTLFTAGRIAVALRINLGVVHAPEDFPGGATTPAAREARVAAGLSPQPAAAAPVTPGRARGGAASSSSPTPSGQGEEASSSSSPAGSRRPVPAGGGAPGDPGTRPRRDAGSPGALTPPGDTRVTAASPGGTSSQQAESRQAAAKRAGRVRDVHGQGTVDGAA